MALRTLPRSWAPRLALRTFSTTTTSRADANQNRAQNQASSRPKPPSPNKNVKHDTLQNLLGPSLDFARGNRPPSRPAPSSANQRRKLDEIRSLLQPESSSTPLAPAPLDAHIDYTFSETPISRLSTPVKNFVDTWDTGLRIPANSPPPFAISPRLAKTFKVKGPIDANRAFMNMESVVRQHGLRRLVREQKFHERPGLKRKRLRRVRWRKRFSDNFHATIVRVLALKKQGW